MEILSYSPSVEAYASIRGDGGSVRYIDLTGDIVSAKVNRVQDGSSTFSITLQNKGWKYNGVFSCFDGIVIYATKTTREKLLSGFIDNFDAFTLYQADFTISGHCTLYKLQNLYFDPGLYESQRLMWSNAYSNGEFDNGHATVIRNILEKAASWPADAIDIQAAIPKDVMDWAREIYESQQEDVLGLSSMIDEFYDILQTHGPQVAGGSTTGFYGDDSKASPAQKRVAEIAESGRIQPAPNMCGAWVGDVYEAAGFSGMRANGIDFWINWGSSGGTDITKAPLGSAIAGSGSADYWGNTYGHIGIRVTNGRVAHAWSGRAQINTLEEFDALNNGLCRGIYRGAVGWVWPLNKDLSKEQ